MSFYVHGGWPTLDNLIPDLCGRMMLELTLQGLLGTAEVKIVGRTVGVDGPTFL